MVAPWPEETPQNLEPQAESQMQNLQELITAVRTLRSEVNIPPGKKVRMVLSSQNQEELRLLERQRPYLELLTKADPLIMGFKLQVPPAAGSRVLGQVEVCVILDTPTDAGQERQRLEREIAKFRKLLQNQEGKLANRQFLDHAPVQVVEKERHRLE